ncbi:MAG: DUF4338 domain-containing protein [Candidatus Nanopusillus acidilobi]
MENSKGELKLNQISTINENYLIDLKERILDKLVEEGFSIINGRIISNFNDKNFIRKLHLSAVKYLIEKKMNFIDKVDDRFINKYIINGKELDIKNIKPKLVKINSQEFSELFNWVKLHWSIPISSGYGRRLRYLVYDEGNYALIGIIGLSDPVFALKDRDTYIGWDLETKKINLKYLMDAFVVGAVPPYSYILGGKLVASLLMSPRIVKDFKNKYKNTKTLISNQVFNGKLVAITTASALGKSSIYDRIKIPGSSEFLHIGWTKGSGEFQFLNELYDEILRIVKDTGISTKNPKWGYGNRNRRKVLQIGFKILGLPDTLLYHNIKRELFLIPLGEKSLEFLRGRSRIINYYNLPEENISEFALRRWVIPRSERDKKFLLFNKKDYSLMTNIK